MTLSQILSHPLNMADKKTSTEWGYSLKDGVLTFVFPGSTSAIDWIQDFQIWPKRVPQVRDKNYKAHGGIIDKWMAIRQDAVGICQNIRHPEVERVIIGGYSQGAGLALLLHEHIAFWEHPEKIETWLYGCPRVIWGDLSPDTLARFSCVHLVQNGNDAATKLPPKWMGYREVGEVHHIGCKRKWWKLSFKDHQPEAYIRSALEES